MLKIFHDLKSAGLRRLYQFAQRLDDDGWNGPLIIFVGIGQDRKSKFPACPQLGRPMARIKAPVVITANDLLTGRLFIDPSSWSPELSAAKVFNALDEAEGELAAAFSELRLSARI